MKIGDAVEPLRTRRYVRFTSSRSQFVCHATRTLPAPVAATVGVKLAPETRGGLVSSPAGTLKRTRPCWATLLTRGNSPPITTYWALPLTLQAAWFWPVNVPGVKSGNQLYIVGLGVPSKLK